MDVSDTEGLQIYTSQKRNCIFVYSENLQILHRAFPILLFGLFGYNIFWALYYTNGDF